MSEWWTYSLSDFLLFSPRTYYRLFELYNLAIWPAQLLALALGVLILALLRPGRVWKGRVVATLLAACWLGSPGPTFLSDTRPSTGLRATSPLVSLSRPCSCSGSVWRTASRSGPYRI